MSAKKRTNEMLVMSAKEYHAYLGESSATFYQLKKFNPKKAEILQLGYLTLTCQKSKIIALLGPTKAKKLFGKIK